MTFKEYITLKDLGNSDENYIFKNINLKIYSSLCCLSFKKIFTTFSWKWKSEKSSNSSLSSKLHHLFLFLFLFGSPGF
jgi:hypothetical protein